MCRRFQSADLSAQSPVSAREGARSTRNFPGGVLVCRRRGDESSGPALLTSCPTCNFPSTRAFDRRSVYPIRSDGLPNWQLIALKLCTAMTLKITANVILALATVFVLSGCATAYQPNGLGGGYSDTLLAPDVYRIVFRGNGYTPPERAQDFALFRASELTLQHGFTCFAIIDERNSTSTSSFTTPGHANTTAYGSGYSSGSVYLNPYGGTYSGTSTAYVNANTTYTPPQTHVFYKPQTGLLVKAFQTKPDGVFTFDASFLQQSLKEKYRIK